MPSQQCPLCDGTGEVKGRELTLGDRLRAARHNHTQDEVAAVVSISRAQIANLEADRGNPSIPVLIELAGYYRVSIDWLLGLSETKES